MLVINKAVFLIFIDNELKMNTNETGEEMDDQSVDMDCDDTESQYELYTFKRNIRH